MTDLKEKLKEIVDLVGMVPEQFKAQCFELLLKDAIESTRATSTKGPTTNGQQAPKENPRRQDLTPKDGEVADEIPDASTGGHDEVANGDLHAKTRKFLERNGISLADVNELFYKEGQEIKSLVEDYHSNKMSEIQIRVALFQSFHNGLATGEFKTTVNGVRAECADRKAIDGPNWAANFKKKASLFDFGEFTRDVSELRLSEDGKLELATLLKGLV